MCVDKNEANVSPPTIIWTGTDDAKFYISDSENLSEVFFEYIQKMKKIHGINLVAAKAGLGYLCCDIQKPFLSRAGYKNLGIANLFGEAGGGKSTMLMHLLLWLPLRIIDGVKSSGEINASATFSVVVDLLTQFGTTVFIDQV